MNRDCVSCDGIVLWGWVCWFCVRAFLAGALTALGSAAAAYLRGWL